MNRTMDLGKRGEEMALSYLEGLGLRLRHRNWRCGHKEVDLIMESPGRVHIVEVKTLKAPVLIEPWEQVRAQKQKNLIAAAASYLARYRLSVEIQFDIVSIITDGEESRIEYIPNAFIPIIY